jgi:hypothetical protein
VSQDQTIRVSAGAVEYCYPRTLTETSGKNISADPVYLTLGTYDAPLSTTPGAPDVITRPSPSTVVAQILISTNPDPNRQHYWVWTKLSDAPEVVWRRSPGRITLI